MTKQTVTTQEHEFLISGCRNQWHADHNHAECWAAFLKHNKAPAGMGIDEFYDWLDAGRPEVTR